MFRSGAFVAEHVSPVTDEQVQPNGVDLRFDSIFKQTEPGRIGRDGKRVGERRALDTQPSNGDSDYQVPPGGYVVRYAETVTIPADHVGFVFPRSSLLRNSCTLDTAVWDAGYEGRGEGLLEVHNEVALAAGARIAQLVLAEARHTGTYDGTYQGEHSRS